MKPPAILPSLVITDHARLSAQISCAMARPGAYLPILDGPRLARPDRHAEVLRRNNAAARTRPNVILLAGLSDESRDAIMRHFTPRLRSKMRLVSTLSDADDLATQRPRPSSPLAWGRDRIGVGLLRALYAGAGIVFSDNPSPTGHVPPKSDHLVVCEEGDELSQVIAANYAFALHAGLYLIPEIDDATSQHMLEDFYSLYERGTAPAEALEGLKATLRERCGSIPIPPSGSLTFVAHKLPYGFAFPEAPSTHLFSHPDLGVAVINGLAAEQKRTRGVTVAVVVSPDETDAPEIDAAEKLIPARGAYLRAYRGPAANVRAVTEMIELFPYDLLIIAAHCGDAPGYRWTYKFTDSEGIERELVVDLAVGFATTDEPEMIDVTQFMNFVSLDGVDWHDPNKRGKLYVGRAMTDFMKRTQTNAPNELKPVKRQNIPRVVGSAALKMHNGNYISLPRAIASEGTPILINNACCSWHRLAANYTFGGARAYIGTLFPVTTSEAQGVVDRLLEKHFGKPLPTALWSAQREVYGDDVRRPYIMTGVYPQHLRVSLHHVPTYLQARLSRFLEEWKRGLTTVDQRDKQFVRKIKANIAFYERELAHFQRRRWKATPRSSANR